jgi:hypothetical protein
MDAKSMSQIFKNAFMLLFFVSSYKVFARPVTYVDGISISSENRSHQNESMVSYTMTRRLAAGMHLSTFRDDHAEFIYAAPMSNVLLGRWNEENQQSNFYFSAGYGRYWQRLMNESDDAKTAFYSPVVILDADTESRTIYASVHHERINFNDAQGPLAYSRFRIGLSPYLADYGSLHSWALIQWDYDHWRQKGSVSTLLRFFFRNVLWEMGVSYQGQIQFNWAIEL